MDFKVNDDLLGKIMYVFAFIFLGYTLFVAVKYPFLSVDGWFTRGLLSLPIMQQISITALDVHPPLYYLILNAVVKALTAVNVDLILSIKIASFIPYVIIFIVSLTKVRKDYGLLAGGLFAFTLLTMCDYFTHYLTARMYSWAMLFVVLGFLYVKPIIEDNDRKSWILLSIFAVLGAYTHYFAAVTFVSLYFLLFIYVIIRNREAIKNWFISVVIGIILYAPWVLILFRQMKHVHSSYWIEPANLRLVAECFSSYITIHPSKIIIIAAAIVLLVLTILILKNYIKSKDTDDEYYLIGILAFALTIIAGTAASIVFKPILIVRYVLPATAMVWIVISIYISKLDIKKVAILLSILVLVIGAANIAYQMQDVHDLHDSMVKDMEFLKSINNNDTIVVYDGMQKYIRFHDDLNNATYFANYELNNETDKQDYVTALGLKNDSFRVPYDITKYPGKTLYLVRDHRGDVDHVNGYTMKTDHKIKNCKFIKFTKNK